MTSKFLNYIFDLLRDIFRLQFARLMHACTLVVLYLHVYAAFAALLRALPNAPRGMIHNIQNSANDMIGIDMIVAGALPVIWLAWKLYNKPEKHPESKIAFLILGWCVCFFAYVGLLTAAILLKEKSLEYFLFALSDVAFVIGCSFLLNYLRPQLPMPVDSAP